MSNHSPIINSYLDVQFWLIVLPDIKKKERKDDIKRAIRKYLNKANPEPERRMFNESIDGVIEVFPLPEDIETMEEATEYFKDFEYIYYRPTYYDCTGQLFTSWYKIFQKPDGRFWAYHSIGRDC